MRRMTEAEAEEFAQELDLDVYEVGVCHACLSFVSFALDGDDERELRRTTAWIARDLWAEGLALPVRAALERARRRGVVAADVAIAEVERRGPRTRIVAAIVRRLAAELSTRTRTDLTRLGLLQPSNAEVVQLRPHEPAS